MSTIPQTSNPYAPMPDICLDGYSVKPLSVLKDFQTRFVYPFFFNRHEVPKATEALEVARMAGRAEIWTCADPKQSYKEELLDHVAEFLFSTGDRSRCGYLKVADAASQSWFQGAMILLGYEHALPVSLVPGLGIELFLSPFGVGILSIALTPIHRSPMTLDPSAAVEFNYRLAQLQPWSAAKIRLPHPGDSPESLARLRDEDREKILPPPSPESPLSDRLGKRGGMFTLAELAGELLEPLKGLGLKPVQPTFSVYTIALFGPEMELGLPAVREVAAPFLSALAQIEESDHAGAPPGIPGVVNVVLNRRHWAGVGQLGAAHLLADQFDDHPFNQQRLPRVRDKYFVQYLMALLQRLVIHRVIDQAGTILGKSGAERGAALETLRGDLLHFAIGGHFTQVSTRHALHRFYQVAQEGLDVTAAWSEVRRAVADIDAHQTQERQEKVADGVAMNLEAMAKVAQDVDEVTRKMDKNLGIIANVQRMVHYIEMAIVSVYFAHLWHMFAENEAVKDWTKEYFHSQHAGDWFVSIGVIVWAVIGFVLAFVLGRVLHRRSCLKSHIRQSNRPALVEEPTRLDSLGHFSKEVREGLRKATHLSDNDPEMALIRVRKVLEYVVRDVFVRRVGEPPGTRPLEGLIQRMVKDGYFPPRLEAYSETIRRLSDVGAHHECGVTTEDARASIGHLMSILKWYSCDYLINAGDIHKAKSPVVAP